MSTVPWPVTQSLAHAAVAQPNCSHCTTSWLLHLTVGSLLGLRSTQKFWHVFSGLACSSNTGMMFYSTVLHLGATTCQLHTSRSPLCIDQFWVFEFVRFLDDKQTKQLKQVKTLFIVATHMISQNVDVWVQKTTVHWTTAVATHLLSETCPHVSVESDRATGRIGGAIALFWRHPYRGKPPWVSPLLILSRFG